MGHIGGNATFDRHGPSHMAHIGARGFATTVERYYQGDRERFIEVLRERGLLKTADREFAMMIGSGMLAEQLREYRPDLLEKIFGPAEEVPW
jgi:hypothetical protein